MTGHLSEEQISAWVDGQLSSDERLLFEAHLPLCEMCRNIFEEMAKVNRLFRQDELTPSPDLWKRISAALDSPRPASWRRGSDEGRSQNPRLRKDFATLP